MPDSVRAIETPALLLDRERLDRNIERMSSRLRANGVALRPHGKTSKSIDVMRRVIPTLPRAIAVSTLREAEYFFEAGITDILYAVGIAPSKLGHAASLIRRRANLSLVVDSVEAARMLSAAAKRESVEFPVLIELDVDGHRAGVSPASFALPEIASCLQRGPGTRLRGVITHAGESYNCRTVGELRAIAERERSGAVHAAELLRTLGLTISVVSVGSTPTATVADDLAGITEVRAGVYMFQDLVMAGIGVCDIEDIALSVLVSVIGHQPGKGWIITDGGWMSLSRDRGTGRQALDQGYGLVRDEACRALEEDLIVVAANQEHGIVGRRDGGKPDFARYPIGTLLRVLPNHACATAAQHQGYHVVEGASPRIIDTWFRCNGW